MKSRMSVAWLILAVFAGLAAWCPEAQGARGSRPGGSRPGAVMTEEARRAAIGQVFVSLEAKKVAALPRLRSAMQSRLQTARVKFAEIIELMPTHSNGHQERTRIFSEQSRAKSSLYSAFREERYRWHLAVHAAAGELIRLRASGTILRQLDQVGDAGVAELSAIYDSAQRTLWDIAMDAIELIDLLTGAA